MFFLKKVILLWQIVILFSKFAVKLLLMIDKNARVLLIYTGGTIGMVENLETGALEAFNFSHLKSNVPEMKRLHFNVDAYLFDPPSTRRRLAPSGRILPGWWRRTDGTTVLSFFTTVRWHTRHRS